MLADWCVLLCVGDDKRSCSNVYLFLLNFVFKTSLCFWYSFFLGYSVFKGLHVPDVALRCNLCRLYNLQQDTVFSVVGKENEQADAGRDGRTCLIRRWRRQGKYFPPFQLTTSRVCIALMPSLLLNII